jgi:hypothetical protein
VDQLTHLTLDQLEAELDTIRAAPSDLGRLELIVRRTDYDQREVPAEGRLDPAAGLVGDNWALRPPWSTSDGSLDPETQLNVMSARVVALVAVDPERRALAGDQLYLDLDLSEANLPAGTQIAIGEAVIEVTPKPHTGCAKFSKRFGVDAMRFVNAHRDLRLRGLNAKVVTAGTIRVGDAVRKLPR